MNIDQRLHKGADELRAALADLPVSDPPERPSRRRGRVLLAALGVGVVAALVAGLVVRIEDDNDPATTEQRTTEDPSTSALPDGVEKLDAGPLSPRGGHSVVWTGEEVIVWGGWGDEMGGTKHDDGAAYDPDTRSWRMIAASPLSARRNHAAAWTGEEMVVFGGDGRRDGAAYDPRSDTWRRLPDAPFGFGAYEVRDREESELFVDGGLIIWQAPQDRVARWDAASESWSEVDGTGLTGLNDGALRATHDRVYAVGTTAYTGAPLLVAATDLRVSNGWTRLEDGTFATARQIVPNADPDWSAAVGGRLVAWSIGLPDTAIELGPGTGQWNDLPPHNVTSCEGAPGPVVMGDRLLIDSDCDPGSIYDSATDTWTTVDLDQAQLEPSAAVWTGSAVISWGNTCCYGTGGAAFQPNTAWLYRPPSLAASEDPASDTDDAPGSPRLSARIELQAMTVPTGGTIDGRVVVMNNTGEAIEVTGCRSIFQIALANDDVEPQVWWLACAERITIPVGESAYPASVRAQHAGCSGGSMGESLPCRDDGTPPLLPPGNYEARLYQSSEVVPEPQPVEVTVVSAP